MDSVFPSRPNYHTFHTGPVNVSMSQVSPQNADGDGEILCAHWFGVSDECHIVFLPQRPH
jgi:hypothetical protein